MAQGMKVKYLRVEEIESSALYLLAEYGRKFDLVQSPPVPVEEILECHIELHLDFDDLPKKLGISDVLGATWIQEKQVLIDRSLDPTLHTSIEGRYRFTLAHELGHWELHRHLFQSNPGQGLLFNEAPAPAIVCRTSSRKEPIEWQADTFAGYLLMPKEMIFQAWKKHYGCLEPYIAAKEIAHLSAYGSLSEDKYPVVEISRKLASDFLVSGQAMQIRLNNLGLIKTEAPALGLFS